MPLTTVIANNIFKTAIFYDTLVHKNCDKSFWGFVATPDSSFVYLLHHSFINFFLFVGCLLFGRHGVGANWCFKRRGALTAAPPRPAAHVHALRQAPNRRDRATVSYGALLDAMKSIKAVPLAGLGVPFADPPPPGCVSPRAQHPEILP